MRPRSLLVLFSVVVALLAFIWFFERDLPSTEVRAERAKKVFALDKDEVLGLAWSQGERRVRLERSAAEEESEEEDAPGEWRLVEPLSAPADDDEVDSLLDTLVGLEKERTLEEFEAGAVGLAEPRARLTVITGAGEEVLLVGREIPASSNMIVQRQGAAEAWVVRDSLWDDLDREPGDWRSRDVFAGERDDIDRVRLGRGEASVLLGRRGEDFWLESPLVDRADGDKVEDLLGDIVGLEIEEFVDAPEGPPAELGFDAGADLVELVLADGSEVFRLDLGAAAGGADDGRRYARRGDQIFEIGDDLNEALARQPADWQAMSLTSLDTWEVNRLRLSDAQGDLELERDAGDWRRGKEKIAYAAVSDLLYALDGAEAVRALPAEGSATTGEPLLRVTLEGDEARETIALYPAAAVGHRATVEGRTFLLVIPSVSVGEIVDKLAAIRAAEPIGDEAEEPGEG